MFARAGRLVTRLAIAQTLGPGALNFTAPSRAIYSVRVRPEMKRITPTGYRACGYAEHGATPKKTSWIQQFGHWAVTATH